jgi:hypothetical protein
MFDPMNPEFRCGCGRHVLAPALNAIPDKVCTLCRAIGQPRSRLIYDRQHGVPGEAEFERLFQEAAKCPA